METDVRLSVTLSAGCLGALSAMLGCGSSSSDTPPTGEDRPFRDEWRPEFSAPFPYDPESEDPGIERIFVGERVAELGGTNRGDVLVEFDAPAQTIEVELRRFTFAGSEEAAEEGFGRIAAIAVDGVGHDCTLRWWDGCTLTLVHDGQTEPLRSGADMRVHLPAAYRHRLEIEAHDVADDTDYPDRADVCVRGFAGEAAITLDSGIAVVQLSDVITPAPACSTTQIETCEAEAWANCGCAFGRLSINSRDFQRSDMTVDIPLDLWASASLSNVDTQGGTCALELDVPGIEPGSISPVAVEGEVGRPPGAPDSSHGYEVELRSEACGETSFVTEPAEFETPRFANQGDLTLCSGCLVGSRCEDLLER
jgi:hypothetical protein